MHGKGCLQGIYDRWACYQYTLYVLRLVRSHISELESTVPSTVFNVTKKNMCQICLYIEDETPNRNNFVPKVPQLYISKHEATCAQLLFVYKVTNMHQELPLLCFACPDQLLFYASEHEQRDLHLATHHQKIVYFCCGCQKRYSSKKFARLALHIYYFCPGSDWGVVMEHIRHD